MIRFENYTILSGELGKLNPMPDIKNMSYIHAGYEVTENVTKQEQKYLGHGMISTMLPYMMQDNYNREKSPRNFKAAILENNKIKAIFLPELGGRLWSIFDKEKNRELLYVNPVFQAGNLGLRNAWFSGGIEFNVGIKGHNPLTCSPLWCAVDKCADGDVLRLYEYERIRGVVYSINAYLPENSNVLYIKCKIENNTSDDKYMYWWTNIAVPETDNTRVLVPADEAFLSFYNENHYTVDKISIPINEKIDTSYPTRLPASRDFFYKIPKNKYSWIAAAEQDGKGLLQCSTKKLFGRKMFVWGHGQGGRNWNSWLSVDGSAYIEIQAGLAHTQLEHIPMKAGEVWEWTEAYTALDINREIAHGDYKKATNATEKYMFDTIGDIEKFVFPSDKGVISSEIIYKGSDWGALEEKKRNISLSKLCRFPVSGDYETAIWHELLEKGVFPCPDILHEPTSYVVDKFWLRELENLPSQNWYSLLHIGVIKYANGELLGAKEAWQKSNEISANPWALRNLSMLYKNEWGDTATAYELILKAFALKKGCLPLCSETASVLISFGKEKEWLEIFETLDETLKKNGRLNFFKALSLVNIGEYEKASEIINPDFIMADIKEGELSVSHLWFELYRRLYAKENGLCYDENDTKLIKAADKKYPLPKKLDFRMHD